MNGQQQRGAMVGLKPWANSELGAQSCRELKSRGGGRGVALRNGAAAILAPQRGTTRVFLVCCVLCRVEGYGSAAPLLCPQKQLRDGRYVCCLSPREELPTRCSDPALPSFASPERGFQGGVERRARGIHGTGLSKGWQSRLSSGLDGGKKEDRGSKAEAPVTAPPGLARNHGPRHGLLAGSWRTCTSDDPRVRDLAPPGFCGQHPCRQCLSAWAVESPPHGPSAARGRGRLACNLLPGRLPLDPCRLWWVELRQ